MLTVGTRVWCISRIPMGRAYEAVAWQQIILPRGKLCERSLDDSTKLAEPALRVVTDWLAKRFTRTAFPDDFHEALRVKEGEIKKTLKKKHRLFSEILLRLDPFDDLGSGDKYELACYLLMSAENHEDSKQLRDARAVAATLEAAFEGCGIEVQVCTPVSEEDLSYAELKELVRWDFDHLTFRDEAKS